MADISQPAPIGAILPTDKHGQQRKRRKDEEDRRPSAKADPHSVADVTEVMGIPVNEVTPKVQETLNTIMAEFDKTRIELDHAKSHIQYLEELADRHPVLPLVNRRGLHRELSRTLALAERAGVTNSFLAFHIQNAEDIRASLGREATEAVLSQVAETLSAEVRDSDVVGSLGGSDFGVILTIADDENAADKAASLAGALGGLTVVIEGVTVALRVVYGLHTISPGESAETVLQSADQDLLRR